ncbi:ABC transporter permease [Aeromicrobium sp.]|uniref:ABC transporter permease n=1 Tax=Aeromicrobium sp. TaxID=1871063 RepID=UPI003D6A8AD0
MGFDVAREQLIRPRMGLLLVNTVSLVVAGVTLSAVIATACAWLVERTDVPVPRVWRGLLVAPLAVPAFVNGYAWISLTHAVEGFAGAVLIVSLSYFPFIYLPVTASLQRFDPAFEETARTLGLGRVAIFTRIVLPQLRPALLGGGLLVALHLLAEFGALQMLRFPTFTTAIYEQFGSTFNGPAANLTATALALLCLVVLVTELRLRGRTTIARTGGGAPRSAVRIRLGGARASAIGVLIAVVLLSLGVPLVSLGRWMLVGASTAFPVAELVSTTMTTLGLAASGAAAATVLAIPVALLVVRHTSRTSTLIERSTFTASALPGIVIALALVSLSLDFTPAIYQTTLVLVAAYVIMFASRAVVGVRAALDHAPPVLEDVAGALGQGSWATFRRVTLPLVAPGIGAGAALVFIAIATELTATLLLAPIGTRTLATQFWSESSSLSYGAAAPYALLLVLLSIPATFLLGRVVRTP